MKTEDKGRLVIGRARGQSLKIGAHVELFIDSIEGGTVKISVVAPRWIPIMRTELLNNKLKD